MARLFHLELWFDRTARVNKASENFFEAMGKIPGGFPCIGLVTGEVNQKCSP